MRSALIIANTEYIDPGLAKLTAPGKDAEDFARVLRDKEICAFDEVNVLLNQPEYIVRGTIDEFFDQKKPDDLLVLYFSGHGVRDELGSLYLAVKNTIRNRLRSTAIKSDYIREAMDQSRSKRQVLILDCCNSGAFSQGTKAATGVSIGTATEFEAGYGRIILTASDSTQFAWEGDKVIGKTDNSLFTHFLVKGLEGEADLDGDGSITVDELYDYAYERVRFATPKQTPSKFSSKQQGEIILRQITRIQDIKPVTLPDQLVSEIENPYPEVRLRAILQLAKLLSGKNLGLARSAREALEHIEKEDDSRRVAQAATQILETIRQAEQLALQKIEEEHLEAEKAEVEQKTKDKVEEVRRSKAEIEEKRLASEKAKAKLLPAQKTRTEQTDEQAEQLAHTPFTKNTVREAREKAEKADNIRKGLRSRKEREVAARYIYVIADEGTPLYHSLPSSNNWTIWLEKGTQLAIMEPIKDTRLSIGKNGHYIEVADSQGNEGFVIATLVSFEQPSSQSLERNRKTKLQTEGTGAVQETTDLKTELGKTSQSDNPIRKFSTQKLFSWPLGTASLGAIAVLVTLSIFIIWKTQNHNQTQDSNNSTLIATLEKNVKYFTSDSLGKEEIYALTANSQLTQVTRTPKQYQSWSPAPDGHGNLYFTSNQSGKTEVYVLTANSQLTQVTRTPKQYQSWSPAPDGHGNLYFTSNQSEKVKVFLLTGKSEVQPISVEISGGNWTGTLSETNPRSEH